MNLKVVLDRIIMWFSFLRSRFTIPTLALLKQELHGQQILSI